MEKIRKPSGKHPNSLKNLLPGGVIGNKGSNGRPRSEIRNKLNALTPEYIDRLNEIANNGCLTADLCRITDIHLKYGIGTQVEVTNVDLSTDLANFAQMLIVEHIPEEIRDEMLEKLAAYMERAEQNAHKDEGD